MLITILVTLGFALFFCLMFYISFSRDRSRYRNCYLLFLAICSWGPFVLNISGSHVTDVFVAVLWTMMILLMITPVFLIFNGVVTIRKEGRQISHLLSLALGITILLGEIAFLINIICYIFSSFQTTEDVYGKSPLVIIGNVFHTSVIYVSMSFLVFMIYVLFLQIIPWKKDFDYVIIHGSGLIDGDRVPKLLSDRLDKAIYVYNKCEVNPKLIPSGGQGDDETVPEAHAMRDYLIARGIPEEDIIVEDKSATTLENLQFSKEIIEKRGGNGRITLVTSNYHVYRALRYCRKIGLKCVGIGSHVAFYYWPSALIREYIAIHYEKKHAVIFILGWIINVALVIATPFM